MIDLSKLNTYIKNKLKEDYGIIHDSESLFYLIEQNSSYYIQLKDSNEKPLQIDLNDPSLNYRLNKSGNNELVIRACYLKNKPKQEHIILDATTGLANDSMVIASAGAKMIMLERNPLMSFLLAQALESYSLTHEEHKLIPQDKLHLQNAENLSRLNFFPLMNINDLNLLAIEFLQSLEIDTIYLDPMYPHKEKKALVKKQMQYLQKLIGMDLDSDDLFANAVRLKPKRIVVKRPNFAGYIGNKTPSYSLKSKGNRFDVYQIG